MSQDTSHGWVKPRADGFLARCGGPTICTTCQTEQMHERMLTGLFGASVGAAQGTPTDGNAQDAARYRALRTLAGLPAEEGRIAAEEALKATGLDCIRPPNPDQFDAFSDQIIATVTDKDAPAC